MGKRKDHHKKIIAEALLTLENFKVTKFHTAQKMPRTLKGVPDLHILGLDMSYWIEIKPRYANYMRDQMSDAQFQWVHDRYVLFGERNRYAIVDDAQALVSVVLYPELHSYVAMGDYHWERYNNWRRGR